MNRRHTYVSPHFAAEPSTAASSPYGSLPSCRGVSNIFVLARALGLALAMGVAPTTARPRPFLVSDHLHVLPPPLTQAMTLLRVENSFFVLYVRAFTCKGPLSSICLDPLRPAIGPTLHPSYL